MYVVYHDISAETTKRMIYHHWSLFRSGDMT